MSKVIIFSRSFPSNHIHGGHPTYFVEQFMNSIYPLNYEKRALAQQLLTSPMVFLDMSILTLKHHTIRAGHKWKSGQTFSPRFWSGKPYASKQFTICEDVVIQKVYNFSIDKSGEEWYIEGTPLTKYEKRILAANDGLTFEALVSWLPKPFSGQIICWTENVNYQDLFNNQKL